MAGPGEGVTQGYSVGVDIGGTFTDVVCAGPQGVVTMKLPTTTQDRSLAAAEALRRLRHDHDVPPSAIMRFAHGTTVATNAVLERNGARIGLITTEGFRDTLEIGRQMRRQLYDLALKPETPGWVAPGARRVEVRERIAADGSVVTPLDPASVERAIAALRAEGVEAIAICLLFSFQNPDHERAVAEAVRAAMPGVPVSLSSEVDPAFREYERTAATCFDAYVKPVVDDYLARMETALADAGSPAPLQVMQSRGGLASSAIARQRPIRLFLSGPAAGVIGARAEADRAGIRDIISIDIGGTSTDIALAEGGAVAVRPDAAIGEHRLRVPMLDIVTLGAGGGSVAWLDTAGGLRVGPRSAGAEPGPACYGRGGAEPAVTDASVVLGFLDPDFFAGGELTLSPELAREALERRIARPLGISVEQAAAGIHRIVNAQIADGMRLVSLNRGLDPRDFTLVALGGAGGIHGAALADELGIRRVLVPRSPGVLSAAGLLSAVIEHEIAGPFHSRFADTTPAAIAEALAALHDRAAALMAREAVGDLAIERAAFADVAYEGQSHTIEVPYDPSRAEPITEAYRRFEEAHRRVNGHAMGAPAKFVNLRVTHWARLSDPLAGPAERAGGSSRKGTRRVLFPDRGPVEAAIHDRARLAADAVVAGPAVLEQTDTTTLVPPGWVATALPGGALMLTPESLSEGKA
jgi:N-methylhydantoinase A